MSNAYPWFDQQRDFAGRKWIGHRIHQVGMFLLIVAAVLSLPALIGKLYSYYGFERSNDSWHKRGLVLMILGLPVTAILILLDPFVIFRVGYETVLAAIDNKPFAGGIIQWQLLGLSPSLMIVGFSSILSSYHYEFASEKYLRHVKKFGLLYRLRENRNIKKLAEGTAPEAQFVAFGIHDEDTLPWRSRRHGMIIGRKADKDFGHGVILGAAGSGKSVQAVNIFDQCIERNFAGIYADFKGSKGVERALRDMARRHGVPFYSFSLYGSTDEEGVYYDPLAWPGLPTDKASVIVSAMPFAEGGGSQFYKNAIEAYLPVQIEIMEKVGTLPGEGTFDFLANTCTPSLLLDRAKDLAANADTKAQYNEWKRRLTGINAETLEGLRGNLNKIINSGGKYLRPPVDPSSTVLDLRDAVDEGAIIYFSFATSLDAVSVVTIGSLLIQDITAMIGARMAGPVAGLRPVLFMPDETSVLEERAELLDNMLRQAREAKVWVWPIAQSLVSWPESTRNEVLSNARTKIAYNVPDKFTQDYLVGGLSKVPWLTFQTGTDSDARAGGRREVSVEGRGFSKVDRGDQLTPGDLNLRDREAYIWFTGGTDTWLTIKRFRRHRVRNEEIEQDIVQIKTVARASILASLNSAGPEDAAIAEAARLRVEHAKARGLARLNGDPAPTSLVEEEAMDATWGDEVGFDAPAISADVDPALLADYKNRQAAPPAAPTRPAPASSSPAPTAGGGVGGVGPAFPFQAAPVTIPGLAEPTPAEVVAETASTAPVAAPAPQAHPVADPGVASAPAAPLIAATPATPAPATPTADSAEEDDVEGGPGSVNLLSSLKQIKDDAAPPAGFTPARKAPAAPGSRPDWLPARRSESPAVDAAPAGKTPPPAWLRGDDEESA